MRLKEEFRDTTVINKSRFIACVAPCRSEEEARLYIEQIRKEYPDASHVCTAYVIGEHDEIQRSSDNHEPAGTAGIPMLESIRHSSLHDVCACVVRYFGGVKLGAGGLIRAYSSAVTDALAKAKKTKDVIFHRYRVHYPYDLSGTLEGWLHRYTEPVSFDYDEAVWCIFDTDLSDIPEQIKNLSRGKAEVEFIEDVVREVSLETTD